jgi:hypothetical protein
MAQVPGPNLKQLITFFAREESTNYGFINPVFPFSHSGIRDCTTSG